VSEPGQEVGVTVDPDEPAATRARPRSALFGRLLTAAFVILVVDQLTKLWAVRTLSDGRRLTVLPGLIDFRLLYNSGAAFSIGESMTWVFTVATAVAVGGILYIGRRVGSLSRALALGAVLGGAVSHLGDRLFREPGFARGHVVDFIDYHGLFVGNVADIALTVGVAVMAVLSWRGDPPRG
jgi:signal peptidase II